MHNLILSPLAMDPFVEKVATRVVELIIQAEKSNKSENKLHSVKSLAEYAGVSELSIRNYILEGKIQAKRIGRRLFIDQSQFEEGLEEVKSLKYKR